MVLLKTVVGSLRALFNSTSVGSFRLRTSFRRTIRTYGGGVVGGGTSSTLIGTGSIQFSFNNGSLPPSHFCSILNSTHVRYFFGQNDTGELIIFFDNTHAEGNNESLTPFPAFSS